MKGTGSTGSADPDKAARHSQERSIDKAVGPHPCWPKAKQFPHEPGIYLFKDHQGQVLYVGKARDLRKRVLSYFKPVDTMPVKTRVLLKKATDLDFVVTTTEKEALLLESSLIKKHRPRYNVILRDDKNYPALRIDPRQSYPRLEIVRRFQNDGALYFGPYSSAHAVRETLKLLNRLFPLRQCKSRRLIKRQRPCLNHSLGRCLGPCAGKVSAEQYRHVVDEVILFLRGKTDRLERQLERQMESAAAKLDFERAAQYRDRLASVRATLEQQHMISSRFVDQDVLGVHLREKGATLVIVYVRHGAVVGQRTHRFSPFEGEAGEVFDAFIKQYYREGRMIPDEILIPMELEDQEVLEQWLSEVRGKRVRIWPAKRGTRRTLLELAERNAVEQGRGSEHLEQKADAVLEQLATLLKLDRVPRRMACVDISNIQGRHAVGSIVTFTRGRPDYPRYRRFSVKEKSEPDDPAMMAEIIERYLEREPRLVEELDLLVVDGGKSQLNRIRRLLEEHDLAQLLPVVGLAKEREEDRGEQGRGLYEKLYLPGRKNPLYLTRYPEALHLLQRLRDEAHRYAVSFYQKRHRQQLLASSLDAIPGVGEKRRTQLLKHFGSLDALRRAGIDDITAVPGISRRLAEIIHDHFHRPADDP